ncbi:DUF6906 family protein [Clostridium perfringens]|nr:hypothetical protein [Clostridium perfringens]MEA5268703.1 hypothetical protein [Clostridium perfringens]MEA5380374.1 hypothetical protein [Clostridium perfringens]
MITKELSVRHKRFLKEQKLNPEDFLYIATYMEAFKFLHKETGKAVWIRR